MFSGSIDKLLLERPSSTGYLQSVAELKSSIRFTSDDQAIMSTAPYEISKFPGLKDKEIQYPSENMQKDYELPHMPPWFVYVGSQKLYKALAGILRLVGLSTMAGRFSPQNPVFFFVRILSLIVLHSCLVSLFFVFD